MTCVQPRIRRMTLARNVDYIVRQPCPTIPSSYYRIASKSFSSFKQLPLELRRVIWDLATTPQVIETSLYKVKIRGREIRRITTRTVVPAILHVCAESRAFGLERYEVFKPSGIFTGTYVDWERDYIYFAWTRRQFHQFIYGQESVELEERHLIFRQSQHVLITQQTFLDSYASASKMFAHVADVAVLWDECQHIPDEDIRDRDSVTSQDVIGRPITLFDVAEGSSGPAATPLSSERTSLRYADLRKDMKMCLTPVIGLRRNYRPLSRAEKCSRSQKEKIGRLESLPPMKPKRRSFQFWRVAELRQEAGSQGLDVTGSKSDLVTRLANNEDASYSEAMIRYEQEMEEYAERVAANR